MIRRRILLGALLAALFAVGWWAGRVRASGDLYANLDLFVEVLHAVQTNYVDTVEPGPLVEGGMRGMLKDLDPYSQYLDAREYEALQSRLSGEFDGVGVIVDQHEGYPIVVAPIEGSPAWNEGVLPGDIITQVDAQPTFGLGIPQVSARLRGAAGTRVTITVVREGDAENHDITIERRHIETPAVPYAFVVAPGVGYLRLANFTDKAGAEVASAVDSLRRAGARSLVLDLRGNPGGLVDQAVAVAQQFVPQGSLIAYTKGRAPTVGKRLTAGGARAELAWPMAVLVDGGSASSSEIVTGALQDLDRALVVGTNSFGKGSVQDVYPLRNRGGALKLTTALYYTASGRSLQKPRKPAGPLLDEEDGGEAPSDSAADSAAAVKPQEFKTPMGRLVLGGGGITPDLEVKPDSTSPALRALEGKRVILRFANRWWGEHPNASEVSEAEWLEFRAFAQAEAGVTVGQLDAARGPLTLALQREHARRRGSAAAARVMIERDPVFLRAAEALRSARGPRDVFASSRPVAPAPKRPARLAPHPPRGPR